MAYVREGDTLVAAKLDRFGRSVTNLIETARELERRGVDIRCLDQAIDTTTAVGKLLICVIGPPLVSHASAGPGPASEPEWPCA